MSVFTKKLGKVTVIAGTLGAEYLAGACEIGPYTQGHDCDPLRDLPEAASKLFATATAAAQFGPDIVMTATAPALPDAPHGLVFTITKG